MRRHCGVTLGRWRVRSLGRIRLELVDRRLDRLVKATGVGWGLARSLHAVRRGRCVVGWLGICTSVCTQKL